MLTAEADVQTEDPGRYLARLCRHASQMGKQLRHRPRAHGGGGAPPEMRHVEWSGTHGSLILDWGQCTLQATPGTLSLRAEAADEQNLTRIQDLVAGRLEKFGRRDRLKVTWQRTHDPQVAPGGTGTAAPPPDARSAGGQ
jgi:hypothetical protein